MNPQVYVACLGCYNEGILKGEWLDADQLEERFNYAEEHDRQDRAGHFNRCPRPFHDEWAIHDYDDCPEITSEHPDIENLIAVMRCIEEHGKPFLEWFNLDPYNKGHHADDYEQAFQDEFYGEFDSEKDFAEHWLWETYPELEDMSHVITSNIDYEGVWIDLRHAGYDFSGGYVFCSQ